MLNPLEIFHNAVRAKEIATVLARYGFGNLLQHLDKSPSLIQRFVPRPKEHLTTWERMRLACEDLGPTFIKFGQILSMRPDIVPQPLAAELRKLQDAARPQPFEEMSRVAAAELGRDIDAVFDDFDRTPVATASLAQVYFARLKGTDQRVAVKIQRPGIHRIVDADLDILAWFARQVHRRMEEFKPYDLPAIVREMRDAMLKELDFRHEARNMNFFNAHNQYPDKTFAPMVFEEWTTARLLVMERVDGKRIDQAALPAEAAGQLAAAGARSLLHQVLLSGFFHADPHPGNLCVASDGRLCFFDWGMVGQLTRRMRYHLADLFSATLDQDPEKIARVATLLSATGKKVDLKNMEKEVTFALREHADLRAAKGEVGRLVLRLFYIFGSNGIDVAQDYSLMAKAVLSIEEAAELLEPSFQIRQVAGPMLRQLYHERFQPASMRRDVGMMASSALYFLKELPIELVRILQRLDMDDLTVKFHHKGLEEMSDSLNSASNRITLGVIIGSLLIGSSLIIRAGVQPYFTLGVFGYTLSALLGLWVIIDIIRHGRHR